VGRLRRALSWIARPSRTQHQRTRRRPDQ